uniref:Uncharacterized protein n=1 Tax=Anopheles darlingi TaxID=43151 RepID=A0A2M4DF31_ANODA
MSKRGWVFGWHSVVLAIFFSYLAWRRLSMSSTHHLLSPCSLWVYLWSFVPNLFHAQFRTALTNDGKCVFACNQLQQIVLFALKLKLG